MPGRIAYLARGNGFGHAARALPVIDALDPSVEVRLASAGTGVEYLRMRGRPHDDLGIADEDDHGREATEGIQAYLASIPDLSLVVCDELFRVPVLCDLLNVPCVFVSCFLGADEGQDPRQDVMLVGARRIVVPDWASLHTVPAFLDQVEFVGPIVAPISLSRAEARARLGIAADTFVGVVALGGLTENRRTHQRELLAAAIALWTASAPADSPLVVLCDAAELGVTTDDARVSCVSHAASPDPDAYLRAADVVFPSAGSTMLKLARSNVPAVVLREPDWPVGRQHVRYVANRSSVRIGWEGDAWQQVVAVSESSGELTWGEPCDVAKLIAEEL